MFDVGFTELLLVGVVALLVVGPERLPGLARTAGAWVGRMRSFIGNVKADIDRELKAEELKRILDQRQTINPLEEIIEETKETMGKARQGVDEAVSEMRDVDRKHE